LELKSPGLKCPSTCLKAIDGNMGAYGWFLTSLPAWGIFELTDEIKMDSLILMSGKSATGNTYGYLISFKVIKLS
jgi:hypothetical protein